MKTFEYKQIFERWQGEVLHKEMNTLGRAGWELVTCKLVNSYTLYIFKRELPTSQLDE